MVDEGRLYLSDWNASPILTLIFWGSLFCLPFGFSFEALTLSTLVSGWLGVIYTFLVMRMVSQNRLLPLIIALLIAVNPIFVLLSATFMMDVHFYALFIMSFFFFIRFYKEEKTIWWVLAFLFSLLGMFLRQFAIVLPLTFFLTELLRRRTIMKAPVLLNFSASIIIFLSYFLFNQWLEAGEMLPSNFRSPGDLLDVGSSELGWRIFVRTGMMIAEAGLWLFPLVIFLFFRSFSSLRKRIKWIAPVLVVFMIPLIRVLSELPAGNIFYDLGLGPVTTRDFYILGVSKGLFSVPWAVVLIRILALAGGSMLITLITDRVIEIISTYQKRGQTDDAPGYYLSAIIAIMLYAAIVMINFTYFDRYLLPLLPVIILLIMPRNTAEMRLKVSYRLLFYIFFIGYASFGILGTRHYLQWNRMRWEMVTSIENEGVPTEKIDGGHEYNGWNGAEIDRDGKWDTAGKDYVISFTRLDGFDVLREGIMSNPLTGRSYSLYLLKRTE